MGFHDGGDSGEGGRAGARGGGGGGKRGNPGRDGRGGMNEGRTAMLRIGTKGWGCWLALRQLGGVRRGIEIANAHYGYFPIEGRIPLSRSLTALLALSHPVRGSRSLFPPPHLVFALSLSSIPFASYTHQFALSLSLSFPLPRCIRSHPLRSLITSLLTLVSPPPLLRDFLFLLTLCRGLIRLSLFLCPSLPLFSETHAGKHIQSLSFPRVPFLSISAIRTSYVDYFFSPFYCRCPRYIPLLVSFLSQFLTLIPFRFALVFILSTSLRSVFPEYILQDASSLHASRYKRHPEAASDSQAVNLEFHHLYAIFTTFTLSSTSSFTLTTLSLAPAYLFWRASRTVVRYFRFHHNNRF